MSLKGDLAVTLIVIVASRWLRMRSYSVFGGFLSFGYCSFFHSFHSIPCFHDRF